MFPFGKPSKSKFASQMRAAIEEIDGERHYEYEAETFRLVRQDGDGEVNLSNMYAEHCALPRKERRKHLERLASVFGSSSKDLPETLAEARGNLRPKIWNRSSFEFMELKRQIEGGKQLDIPLYPVGSHLYSSLVYDTENAMRSISNEELEAWGVSYYEALEIACQNLDESTLAFASIGEHFHSSMSGDDYDSSRVLLLNRIQNLDVVGEHVAIVPQRDAMYVAGTDDETSLKIMFELTAKSAAEEARPQCPLPMKLVDGEWVDWVPPKNHVVRREFDDLELQFLGTLYTDQKELLDAIFEVTEDAPFVAKFSAIQQEEDEHLHSYCVWGQGVDSLLPRTQIVVFMDDSGMVASGEWDHVAGIVGDLIVADESCYPARYRVREFPSDEQLAAIGKIEPFTN